MADDFKALLDSGDARRLALEVGPAGARRYGMGGIEAVFVCFPLPVNTRALGQ